MVELWCYIEGDATYFLVTILPSQVIYDLKEVIYGISGKSFVGCDAADLTLTKIDVDPRDRAIKDLIDSGQFRPPSTPSLDPMDDISDVWPEQPPNKHIHVFVSLHVPAGNTVLVLGKRWRSADPESAINSKLAKTAPSTLGKLSIYQELQGDLNQKISDDRPGPDRFPPISLIFSGFGEFLDAVNRPEDEFEVDAKRQELELLVDTFADEMTKFYEAETSRRDVGLRVLNRIVSSRGPEKFMVTTIGSDGYYDGPHGALLCIVEFANELCDIHSMPMVERMGYVAHSQSDAMFQGSRVGLTVVGPYVTFYGIIFLGQWRMVSLTPTLSCIESARDGGDRRALYAAFSAALVLLDRIDEAAKRIISAPPTNEGLDYNFPYISALPRRGPRSDEEIRFRILALHPDERDYRLLFIAETLDSDKKRILVKFARRYAIKLHEFCARRGGAPEVLGFKQIPGGWSVIAMEYISSAVHPSQSPNLTNFCDQWAASLKDLVKSFHDSDFVHGDLREPNILCNGEEVMLIDFDWGGKVGEAYYPTTRLSPELTNGRRITNPKITKDDDLRVLGNTLKGLKEKVQGR